MEDQHTFGLMLPGSRCLHRNLAPGLGMNPRDRASSMEKQTGIALESQLLDFSTAQSLLNHIFFSSYRRNIAAVGPTLPTSDFRDQDLRAQTWYQGPSRSLGLSQMNVERQVRFM